MASRHSHTTYQLPLAFEVSELEHALAQIARYEPQKQRTYQSPTNHQDWGGVSLYAIAGRWDDASPGGPARVGYQPTEMLSVAPYFRHVMDALQCPKRSVRISILNPGGRINPHRDQDLGFDKGAIRVHVPITTSDGIEFLLGGERCAPWRPGELWYGDFSLEHSLAHHGTAQRVHIVADLCINDWLLGLFPPALIAAQPAILRHRAPIELDAAALAGYRCTFRASGSLDGDEVAAAFPVEWGLGGELPVEVLPQDGQLVLRIAGEHVIGLEAVGDDRFRLVGAPLYITLRFQRAGGQPAEVVVYYGDDPVLAFPASPAAP
jgi:aspartyl/asparaginyl beta-hydroxylase